MTNGTARSRLPRECQPLLLWEPAQRGCSGLLVDAELVALGVEHGHRVVTFDFLVVEPKRGGAGGEQLLDVGVDELLANHQRDRSPAAHRYVDMDAVLCHLPLRHLLEPDSWATP